MGGPFPHSVSTFVGRRAELDRILSLVPGENLFVVYGPPGSDYAVAVTPTAGPSLIKGLDFCFDRDQNLELVGKSFGGRPPITPVLDSTGEITLSYTVPDDPSLVWMNLYIQGVIDLDPNPAVDNFEVTNCIPATVFP